MTISSFSRQANFDEPRKRVTHPGLARSDAAIEEEIWDGIFKDRSLGPRYEDNLQVEVESGRVTLRGHVVKQWHIPLIANIVDRAEGVLWLKSELVADEILQEQVIKALLLDERTAPYIFTVKSSFGWIHLRGLVPSPEIAKAAEGVAGFVPTVRGILSLPSVFGLNVLPTEESEPIRRTLQPRVASNVYQDGEGETPVAVGQVAQVIIDPCSRLVNHVVVRINGSDSQSPAEKLVPMLAVEASDALSTWLKEGERVEKYPAFEQRSFPLPPASWRPPFPYLPGMVRWSLSPE